MSHAFTRVPARMQIHRKAGEIYAKVVGGHAPTNRGDLEQAPYQGEI
jgi:hypothetical protein